MPLHSPSLHALHRGIPSLSCALMNTLIIDSEGRDSQRTIWVRDVIKVKYRVVFLTVPP